MPSPSEQVHLALVELRSGRSGALFAVGDLVVDAATARIRDQLAAGEALRLELRQHRAATIERVSALAASWCRDLLRQLQRTASEDGGRTALDPAILTSATYLERLTHLTVERLLVHPASPPLRLSPLPEVELTADLGPAPVVAVIFDYPLAIVHELYPLWTDAFVFGQGNSFAPVVIGVHVSWLDEGCRARRAIVYSDSQEAFLEADLPTPLSPAAALLLAQAPATHRQLSQRLQVAGVPHINDYSRAAEVADDKWACYERWSEVGVATPPTCLLRGGAGSGQILAQATQFMAACHPSPAGWFLQPRHGTESAGVKWLSSGGEAPSRAVAAWQRLARNDDAILRPQVGLIWLEGPRGPRAFDLRLHVCRHAGRCQAESGYLICAPSEQDPVSSVARGASLERLSRLAAPHLRWRSDAAVAVPWSAADWERALDTAARAAAALELDLSGVDLKLDLVDGSAQPLVLDANPRPAGLFHGDLVGAGPPEAGVGAGLWHRFGALTAGHR